MVPHDLQIAEDMDLQRRTWRFERIGWVALTLVLVASLLGLFGPGLLGPATAATPRGALKVDYPRFARMQTPLFITVQVRPREGTSRELRLWFDADYLMQFSGALFVPEPRHMEAGPGRVTLEYAHDPAPGPVTVRLELEARSCGPIEGRVGLEGDESVTLEHFVFP